AGRHRAACPKHGRQFRQSLHARIWPRSFVACKTPAGALRLAVLETHLLYFDGYDFIVKTAGRNSFCRPLMGLEGKTVLILPGDSVLRSYVLCGDPHGDVDIPVVLYRFGIRLKKEP